MNSEINLKQIRFENNLTQTDIANLLGITKQQVSNIENGKTPLTEKNKYILENKLNDMTNKSNNLTYNTTDTDCPYKMEGKCPCKKQFKLDYIEFLPEEAKLEDIPDLHVDARVMCYHWQRKPENLRIIPMQGDCLSSYVYPCQNRDILIIDISSNIPTREGLYVYSAHNNTMIFVAKLSQSVDGTIKVEKFEKSGEITEKKISPEKQKEVDFRVIGRVVKNESLSL